jgi:hypothetical protein
MVRLVTGARAKDKALQVLPKCGEASSPQVHPPKSHR